MSVFCPECYMCSADMEKHLLDEHGVHPSAEREAQIVAQRRAEEKVLSERVREDLFYPAGAPIVSK